MTVKEIVAKYLKDNGYDGLFNRDIECGCELADLIACGEGCDECEPGRYCHHKTPDKRAEGDEVDCEGGEDCKCIGEVAVPVQPVSTLPGGEVNWKLPAYLARIQCHMHEPPNTLVMSWETFLSFTGFPSGPKRDIGKQGEPATLMGIPVSFGEYEDGYIGAVHDVCFAPTKKETVHIEPSEGERGCGNCEGLLTMGDRGGLCIYCARYRKGAKKSKWQPISTQLKGTTTKEGK